MILCWSVTTDVKMTVEKHSVSDGSLATTALSDCQSSKPSTFEAEVGDDQWVFFDRA